jgi:2-oxoglutarate dehydrogenase E2 component (dihydrolipoamide succinyltransferase)
LQKKRNFVSTNFLRQTNSLFMILEVKVPSPGESITEVEIESWLVESGQYVEMDAELAEINSDKATLTINAENAGAIEILVEEGETVEVGQVIAKIDTEAEGGTESAPQTDAPAKEEKTEPEKVAAPARDNGGYASGHPSASAAKLMAEKGLDSASVKGSGRGGRITKTDVLTHKPAAKTAPPPPQKEEAPTKKEERPLPALPVVAGGTERTQTREKMSLLRRKIAERLVAVKNETAMLTTFNEVDLHEVVQMRKKYKEKFKETHGVGLGYMSFFTKAVTMALMEFPAVNAQIDGKEMVFHNYADISIAVSSDRGLVVPVIRDAHNMSPLADRTVRSALRPQSTQQRSYP